MGFSGFRVLGFRVFDSHSGFLGFVIVRLWAFKALGL